MCKHLRNSYPLMIFYTFKIYDRLQPLGVCLGYEQSQNVLRYIGQTYTKQLVAAVQEGKRLRFVGDNVKYAVGIRDQIMENDGKSKNLHHAFASVVLINEMDYSHLSSDKPQRSWTNVTVQDLRVRQDEFSMIRKDYTLHILKAAVKHIPFFKCFDEIPQEDRDKKLEPAPRTQVIPLETVLKNEQYYADVVDILDSYEDIIADTFHYATKELGDNTKIHIGGDLLTRERFSGAKVLRASEGNVEDRFGHLGPITFEMFHLLMNYLKVYFDYLYSDKSTRDIGTLKCEINCVMRTQVDCDVKKAYEADKDFVVSFIDAHLVELLCEYFGLEDHLSLPTKNIPPEFQSSEERLQWVLNVFGQMIDKMVWPKHKDSTCSDVEGR